MFNVSTMLVTCLVLSNVLLASALLVAVLMALQIHDESKDRDQ